VANSSTTLQQEHLDALLTHNRRAKKFIERTFAGLYFSDAENRFLDQVAANLRTLPSPELQSLAIAAACRACLKRRPRGVFTYIGEKYHDGRRDLRIGLREHFIEATQVLNDAVFSNDQNCNAVVGDVFDWNSEADLVYMDPPYVSRSSDNDYSRRYHFLEGFARYWEGLAVQEETLTKKFARIQTPFASQRTIREAFDRLFRKFADSTLVVSYSSTGIPERNELRRILRRYKRHVHIESQSHSYSFGTHGHKVRNPANRVEELVFIAD
jgi:DNA adenine methylase